MTARVIARLCWKEYRTLRAFGIAMGVALVGIHGLLFLLMANASDRMSALFTTALVLPVFYSLGCGATLFATEKEAETYSFLRALPVAAWKVCLGKAAFAAVSVPLYFGLSWLSFALFTGGKAVQAPGLDYGMIPTVGVLGAAELFVWAAFFSLVLARPLWAAILGVTVASTVIYTAGAISDARASLAPYGAFPEIRIAMVVLVAAVDAILAARWFATPAGLWRQRAETMAKEGLAAEESVRIDQGVSRWTVMGRLLWQAWRQSGRTMLLLVLMTVPGWVFAVGKWLGSLHPSSYWGIMLEDLVGGTGILFWVAVPAVAGANVFRIDQLHPGVGFLTQRGATAGTVWWSRQLVWLLFAVPLGIAGVVVMWGILSVRHSSFDTPKDWIVLTIPVYVVAGYAMGQMCSVFFRSGVLAHFFALLGTAVFWGWIVVAWVLELSWFWSVLPLIAAMCLASYARTGSWMLQRGGLAGWWKPLAIIALPLLAILAAIPLVRISQVPYPSPGFDPESVAVALSPEAEATQAIYRRALENYVPLSREGSPGESNPLLAGAEVEKWLALNRRTIAEIEEASRRKACGWSANDSLGAKSDLGRMEEAARLLYLRAQRATEMDDLDSAASDFRTLLRVSVHMRQHSCNPYAGQRIEGATWSAMVPWAGHPGQSAARIQTMLKEADAVLARVPSLRNSLQLQYLNGRDGLLGHWPPESLGIAGDRAMRYWVWQHLLPWERQRAVRVLNYLAAEDMARLSEMEMQVSTGAPIRPMAPERSEASRQWVNRWLTVPRLFDAPFRYPGFEIASCRHTLAQRNAARIILALHAYRADHREFPATLDRLKPQYLAELPIDPCSGEPFGYYPHGIPERLRAESQSTAGVDTQGVPFLWSSGDLQRQADIPGLQGLRSKYSVVASAHPYQAATEFEILQCGWHYPIVADR